MPPERAPPRSPLWPRTTRIYLVRHAESVANAGAYFAGQSDAPLSERGRRQAEALGQAFARVPLDALYASDLERARDTAAAIVRGRLLDVVPERGLRERDMGELSGVSFDEVRERSPELWQKILARDPYAAPPGGESHAELAERVRRTLGAIVPRHRGQAIALVAHGGTIAHAARLLLGVDDFALPFWVAADNASVTRVDHVEPAEGVLLPRLAYANRVAAAEGDAF
ncbi:MAG TPA: histidine phosphatase family protein [Polyangiaceae bacterium]|nr:histidine phosphatase family protein [Polyangiaceae bacterium]